MHGNDDFSMIADPFRCCLYLLNVRVSELHNSASS
jgi:hypothetical protein